jgi:hypothetical protein
MAVSESTERACVTACRCAWVWSLGFRVLVFEFWVQGVYGSGLGILDGLGCRKRGNAVSAEGLEGLRCGGWGLGFGV